MDRRTFLALAATPAAISAMYALQSCSSAGHLISDSSTPGTVPQSNAGAGAARSDKPRSSTTLADAAAATASVNDFAVALYKHISAITAGNSANLVFSGASVVMAVAMARAGARGTTATEIDAVLHITDAAAFAHSANALSGALDSRTRRIERPQNDPVDITLNIANSLWGQTGLDFETAFLDVLASEYGAGLQLVDYKADPERARQVINAWVDDRTKQRIPELIAQGDIGTDTRLTLVNAIYMKAPWLNTFAKEATNAARFSTQAGVSVQAPTMRLAHELNYAKGAGWQAVELPYIGEELSMLIVLPGVGTDLAIGVDAMPTLRTASTLHQVNLSLPKFDIETSTDLSAVLGAMGMPTAFSDVADFSGMTTAEKLTISGVIHQANITVDEEGTEAAAATAVVMRTTSAPEPLELVDLIVDRPFVFAIRDNPTGALLFIGHIGDPTATRA